MNKSELARKCNRSHSSIYRMIKTYNNGKIVDLTPELEEKIIAFFKKIDEERDKPTEEENEKYYREVYDEIYEKGYMTTEEFRKRFKGRTLDGLYNAFDNLYLFTYSSTVRVLKSRKKENSKSKNKYKSVACIRPCKLAWEKIN